MTLRPMAVALALLVGSVSALAQPSCAPTRPDMEGPFYVPGAPLREATGRGLVVSGVVRSGAGCAAIRGARVEWWQASPQGQYDEAHRGAQVTGAAGRYEFASDFPPPYAGRPSHIHLKAFAPGHRTLTTQLYLTAGQSQATFDLVLVKE